MVHLLYIDPGSGSMLYQALLSGLLTLSLFFQSVKNIVWYGWLKQATPIKKEIDEEDDEILKPKNKFLFNMLLASAALCLCGWIFINNVTLSRVFGLATVIPIAWISTMIKTKGK